MSREEQLLLASVELARHAEVARAARSKASSRTPRLQVAWLASFGDTLAGVQAVKNRITAGETVPSRDVTSALTAANIALRAHLRIDRAERG